MLQPVEVTSNDFEDFLKKIAAAFASLEDPGSERDMEVAFPSEEFPIMPRHVESQETMTSINDKVMQLTTVVMQSAKRRVFQEKGAGMDKLRQYIVRPANIEEADRYIFRLTPRS